MLTFCFGFDAATAKALREHKHETKDPKTGEVEVKKLEEFSVRWLSKGLGAYGPVGCLGDAVNLVLALLYDAEPADKSESALVDALMLMKHLLSEAAMGRPSALAAARPPCCPTAEVDLRRPRNATNSTPTPKNKHAKRKPHT